MKTIQITVVCLFSFVAVFLVWLGWKATFDVDGGPLGATAVGVPAWISASIFFVGAAIIALCSPGKRP